MYLTTPHRGPAHRLYGESCQPQLRSGGEHESLLSDPRGSQFSDSGLDSALCPKTPMQDSEHTTQGRSAEVAVGPAARPATELSGGPPADMTELVDGLYEVLRGEARRQLSARPLHTLQPTALLNEALLRFLSRRQRSDLSEGELYTYVAKVMRTVLVDHARTKGSVKRGGHVRRVPLDKLQEPVYEGSGRQDVLAVHDALEVLAAEEPEFAELAELRYFGRMTVPEVAALRGVPESRVKVASQCLRRLLELDYDER